MIRQQAKTVRQGSGNDPLWPDARITVRAGLQTAPIKKILASKNESRPHQMAKTTTSQS